MRLSIWDVFAILLLAGAVLTLLVFGIIFNDPFNVINPFPPFPAVPTLFVPSPTATLRSLPTIMTPDRLSGPTASPLPLKPSSTLLPTSTGFILPTFTKTPTRTPTATNTGTPTRTRTVTPLPTYTRVPTYTLQPTFTQPPPTPTETLVPPP